MARPLELIDVGSEFDHVGALWSPRIVAGSDGLHVEIDRGRGEYGLHPYEDTDDLFGFTQLGGDLDEASFVGSAGVEQR